jgi:hypothetical protein
MKAQHTTIDSAEQDAERFRYLISDPETGRHLLLLLSQGKGDASALRRMIDRISASSRLSTQETRQEPPPTEETR